MADPLLLELPSPNASRSWIVRRRWFAAASLVMLLGLFAVSFGLYVGFEVTGRLVALPAGLPAAETETVAIGASAGGMILLLLGAVVFQRSFD